MDKAQLLTPRIETGEVEIPGLGTIIVRGMSRWVINEMDKRETQTHKERFILSQCMVDPAMTEDEVAEWQKASPANEINIVSLKINELSGINPEAFKEAYKSLLEQSGLGV